MSKKRIFEFLLVILFLYGLYVFTVHTWVLYGWENLKRVKFSKDPNLVCCYYKKFQDGSYLVDFRGKSPIWEDKWVIRCPKNCEAEMVSLNERYFKLVWTK